MTRRLDDLLDVTQAAQGRIELRHERVDIALAIARAVEAASYLFVERCHWNVVPGATTKKQVREIFGPPWKAYPLARLEREEWDYLVRVDNRWFDYLVRFSDDGIVREAYLLHDPIYDAPSRR